VLVSSQIRLTESQVPAVVPLVRILLSTRQCSFHWPPVQACRKVLLLISAHDRLTLIPVLVPAKC
jgi:hypothetical protein